VTRSFTRSQVGRDVLKALEDGKARTSDEILEESKRLAYRSARSITYICKALPQVVPGPDKWGTVRTWRRNDV